MSQDNQAAVNGIKTTGVGSVSAAVGDGPSSGFYIFTGSTAGGMLKAPLLFLQPTLLGLTL